MQIDKHVFVVTGASSGIGLAAAVALTARGGKVALLARTKLDLDELSEKLPDSFPFVTDMTEVNSIRSAIEAVYHHYGRIDGLVNNAGRSYAARVEMIEPVIFDEIFRLNVLGPIVAMQEVIPIMRVQGRGVIINVNSGTSFMTIPEYSVYSASKRALMGFSLTARAELEKDSIIVSEVYPFITATNFGKNRMGHGGPPADYSKGDTPEFVAELIIQAIEQGGAQYFANEHIKALAGA